MKSALRTSITLAAVGTLLLACGTPPRQGRQAIEQEAERHGQVTVGGCLQEGEETGTFVLRNARLAFEPAGAPVGNDQPEPPPLVTSDRPMTGTLPADPMGPHYVIEPPEGLDLQAQVGRQLQITGVLETDPDAGPQPVGTTGEYDRPGTNDGSDIVDREGAHGLIRAEEVRVIADRCIAG